MAEKKEAKKETVSKKVEKKANKLKDFEKMELGELRDELQKLHLLVKTGEEKDTSLVRKVKKLIARKLTSMKIETK